MLHCHGNRVRAALRDLHLDDLILFKHQTLFQVGLEVVGRFKYTRGAGNQAASTSRIDAELVSPKQPLQLLHGILPT